MFPLDAPVVLRESDEPIQELWLSQLRRRRGWVARCPAANPIQEAILVSGMRSILKQLSATPSDEFEGGRLPLELVATVYFLSQ